MDEAGFRALMEEVEVLVIKELWITADLRSGREEERWLNGVLGCS